MVQSSPGSVVTRNVKDFEALGVRALDPFVDKRR
jgi:hypothetical protein